MSDSITQEDFTRRFTAEAKRLAGVDVFDDGVTVDDYCRDVAPSYYADPHYRDYGPEACAGSCNLAVPLTPGGPSSQLPLYCGPIAATSPAWREPHAISARLSVAHRPTASPRARSRSGTSTGRAQSCSREGGRSA